MPKKKLVFTIPKNYPELSLERSIIFTANTIITNTSIEVSNNFEIISFLCWLLYVCIATIRYALMAITVYKQQEIQKFYSQETQRDFYQVSTISQA